MVNFAMLDHVVGVIEANPEKHDQANWAHKNRDEDGGFCGTTMCFAGWTVFLNGAQIKFKQGVDYAANCIDKNGVERDIEQYAAEILGLDYVKRNELFFDMGDIDDLKKIIKDWSNEEVDNRIF